MVNGYIKGCTQLWRRVSQPSIVRIFIFFASMNTIFLKQSVMEWVDGKTFKIRRAWGGRRSKNNVRTSGNRWTSCILGFIEVKCEQLSHDQRKLWQNRHHFVKPRIVLRHAICPAPTRVLTSTPFNTFPVQWIGYVLSSISHHLFFRRSVHRLPICDSPFYKCLLLGFLLPAHDRKEKSEVTCSELCLRDTDSRLTVLFALIKNYNMK